MANDNPKTTETQSGEVQPKTEQDAEKARQEAEELENAPQKKD